jgi:hypothetical protein
MKLELGSFGYAANIAREQTDKALRDYLTYCADKRDMGEEPLTLEQWLELNAECAK